MLAQATTLHAQSAASAPPSQPDNASRADVQAPVTSRSLPANARRARAQAQPQVPAAKPAVPPDRPAADTEGAEQTTATYGDWQIRCQLTPAVAGQSARRSCELVQSVVLQGQTAPFAQLGFGRLAAAGPIFFTAVVPTNVTFPSSVKVALDGNDKQPPLEIPWTRCLPGGCFASIEIKDDVMKRWRTQSQSGRVTFKNGAGQDLAVPISFKGLAQALDAFAKEN
jgi:invasion protein IalB